MFILNKILSFFIFIIFSTHSLFAGNHNSVKENIPPISILKRKNQDEPSSHNPKRQKRPSVTFNEVTSLGAPLKDCQDDRPERIGFPHEEVERLQHLEGKPLVIYSDEIRDTDDSPTMKVFSNYYAEDGQIQRRLTAKLNHLSQGISQDETWEWGFHVLSRFWGLETEPHPKTHFTRADLCILKYIEIALLDLLGDIESTENFESYFSDIYNDALDEYLDASTSPSDSQKLPSHRKRFTISHKVFNLFGITRTQYRSLNPQIDSKQFRELYSHIHNQKIDNYEKRYTLRSEQAKETTERYFRHYLEVTGDEEESEQTERKKLTAALEANETLTLSLRDVAKTGKTTLDKFVGDEESRTTQATRKLLLIALKMHLLRPISWEEKAYFNRFEPGFFPEKSDEIRAKKYKKTRQRILEHLSKSKDPVFRDLYCKIKPDA